MLGSGVEERTWRQMGARREEWPMTQGYGAGKDLGKEVEVVDGVIERWEIFRGMDPVERWALVGEENTRHARGYDLEHPLRNGALQVACEPDCITSAGS